MTHNYVSALRRAHVQDQDLFVLEKRNCWGKLRRSTYIPWLRSPFEVPCSASRWFDLCLAPLPCQTPLFLLTSHFSPSRWADWHWPMTSAWFSDSATRPSGKLRTSYRRRRRRPRLLLPSSFPVVAGTAVRPRVDEQLCAVVAAVASPCHCLPCPCSRRTRTRTSPDRRAVDFLKRAYILWRTEKITFTVLGTRGHAVSLSLQFCSWLFHSILKNYFLHIFYRPL